MNHSLFVSRSLTALFLLVVACLAATTGLPPHSAAAPPPPPHVLTLPMQEIPFRATEPSSVTPLSDNLLPDDLTATSRIVFQSYRDNNWEIYVARGNGGYPVRLTYDAAPDLAPRLGPAALPYAFTSRRTGAYEIFVANMDGSGPWQITPNGGDDAGAAWSFDGNRFVYESYVGGQWDVFTINVDGSNPQRLTNSPGYDGAAAWSPDGTKIAFTSRRNGELGIWVMNVDGSGQTRLSTQPAAENPTWSPDGTRIAFDADSDGDTWHEIWVMNANGSNPRRLYRPEDEKTDALTPSWSPDGRYIAFMYLSWIEYEGQWYWTSSRLRALDSVQPWAPPVFLGSGDRDWRPDWQAVDLTAPTSNIQPLPAQSPYAFTVRWSGGDQGRSGILNYVVQVKDNDNGWNVWQDRTTATSAVFFGDGGHVYSFRSQANDRAGNTEAWPIMPDAITTVEGSAPVTSVDPLPEYLRNGNVITWSGTDPGGSGIHTYDVQYQVINGVDAPLAGNAWVDWQVRTAARGHSFVGTPLQTYAFRSRGLDRARNWEEWPSGNGDARTILYSWGISGTVRDNRGVPIVGAAINTTPAAFSGFVTDPNGAYHAYVGNSAATYAASWSKLGYGVLPMTHFGADADVVLDAVLPPLDQALRNGDFEQPTLTPWIDSGVIPVSTTVQVEHTGDRAALLGCSPLQFSTSTNISTSSKRSVTPAMKLDQNGVLHVVWVELDENSDTVGEIFYAQRNLAGSWSTPLRISTTAGAKSKPQIGANDQGGLHVIWAENTNQKRTIYYRFRSPTGVWSAPQDYVGNSNLGYFGTPRLAVTPTGVAHSIWYSDAQGASGLYYAFRSTNGIWSPIVRLAVAGERAQLIQDTNGALYVAWAEVSGSIFYKQRRTDGTWTGMQEVPIKPYYGVWSFSLFVGSDATVYVVWTTYAYMVLYTERRVNQEWLLPVLMPWAGYFTLIVDEAGIVHVVWLDNAGHLYYSRKIGPDLWTPPAAVWPSERAVAASPRLIRDQQDHIYLVWQSAIDSHVYYARLLANQAWATPVEASPGHEGVTDYLFTIAPSGMGNLVWVSYPSASAWEDLFYAGTPLATRTANATLSQTVTVPVTMTTATLSFFYKLGATTPAGDRWLSVTANDGINTSTVFSTTNPVAEWTHRWFGPLPWAGKTITLSFNLHDTAGGPCAWAYLDDVSLGSAYPDLWLSLAGPPSTTPGATLMYTMTYGNRGGATAVGATISDTLPAGLTFIRANPPPSAASPALTWNLGNLAARSGPFTIMIEARVPPTATAGSLVNRATMVGITPEIERGNNTATTTTAVTGKVFAPLYVRARR